MNLEEICTTLAEGLATLDTLAGASDTLPADVKDYPWAAVGFPTEIVYGATMGLDMVKVPVQLAVSRADLAAGQRKLSALLSRGETGNVISKLRSMAKTDAWRQLRIANVTEIGDIENAGTLQLGATINLEILV